LTCSQSLHFLVALFCLCVSPHLRSGPFRSLPFAARLWPATAPSTDAWIMAAAL
jgi:hypothetical protein